MSEIKHAKALHAASSFIKEACKKNPDIFKGIADTMCETLYVASAFGKEGG